MSAGEECQEEIPSRVRGPGGIGSVSLVQKAKGDWFEKRTLQQRLEGWVSPADSGRKESGPRMLKDSEAGVYLACLRNRTEAIVSFGKDGHVHI